MKIFSGLLVGCAESTQHAIILWGWLLNVDRPVLVVSLPPERQVLRLVVVVPRNKLRLERRMHVFEHGARNNDLSWVVFVDQVAQSPVIGPADHASLDQNQVVFENERFACLQRQMLKAPIPRLVGIRHIDSEPVANLAIVAQEVAQDLPCNGRVVRRNSYQRRI